MGSSSLQLSFLFIILVEITGRGEAFFVDGLKIALLFVLKCFAPTSEFNRSSSWY